jgi:glutathione synthase
MSPTTRSSAARNQSQSPQSDPRILIVAQERERNAFDQRWLEYELLQRHGIRAIRRTFTSLISDASIASQDRTLRLRDEASPQDSLEISVVYYRSGYTPTDYTSDDHWKLRLDLERSQAIKCPTVALQLAGAKKVQQVLSEPGVVESFFEGSKRFSSQDVAQLRETWSGLYPLDETSELGREGLRLAQEESQRFVMKPQREGGGNNIYRDEIPKALAAMSKRDQSKSNDEPKEREGYILMELIQPPTGLGNYLIRPPAPASSTGGAEVVLDPSNSKGSHLEGLTSAECRLSADVVSELGIYGVSLFRRGPDGKALDEEDYYNEPKAGAFDATKAPYLLRTKGRESDEGGVAVGFSVLDSVLLI